MMASFKMIFGFQVLLLVAWGCSPSAAFIFKTGECKSIQTPMANFDISQFVGTWYVIQSSNTASRCHSFTIEDKGGSFAFTVNKQLYSLLAAGIVHNMHYEAQIYPNPDNPAQMVLRLPSRLYTDVAYEVIGTDYTNWAVMWSCKPQMFGHLQSALILSRTDNLPSDTLQDIVSELKTLGVDGNDLSTVQQQNCNPELGGGLFTMELAQGLSSVSVDWETLVPPSSVPAEISEGCFVLQGDYFYFRAECPTADDNPTSSTNTSDYYIYYYEDDASAVEVDGGDDQDGNTADDSGDGEYYYEYYYYDEDDTESLKVSEGSADEEYYYDEEGSGGSGDYDEDYYDDEYYDEDYYYDDEYYYDDDYYDDYYDYEGSADELRMNMIEKEYIPIDDEHKTRDLTTMGIQQSQPASDQRLGENMERFWNIISQGLGELDLKQPLSVTNDTEPGSGVVSEGYRNIYDDTIDRREDHARLNRTQNYYEMDSNSLLRMKRDNRSKQKQNGKAGNNENKDDKKGKDKDIKKDTKKDKDSIKKNSKKKDSKQIDGKEGKKQKKTSGKQKKGNKNKKKNKRKKNTKRRRYRKRKRMNKSKRRRQRMKRKRRKNKMKNNPLVARLIIMSGRLQKFLMAHNIGIRKIPKNLRFMDLYAYFKDRREKNRLIVLLKKAKRMWMSKRKRTVKKKGKKTMKIFKHKNTRKKNKNKNDQNTVRKQKGKNKIPVSISNENKNIGKNAKKVMGNVNNDGKEKRKSRQESQVDSLKDLSRTKTNGKKETKGKLKKKIKKKVKKKKKSGKIRKHKKRKGKRKRKGGKKKVSKRKRLQRKKLRKKIRKAMRKQMRRKNGKGGKKKKKRKGKKKRNNKKNKKEKRNKKKKTNTKGNDKNDKKKEKNKQKGNNSKKNDKKQNNQNRKDKSKKNKKENKAKGKNKNNENFHIFF